jgi:hypothetical protein
LRYDEEDFGWLIIGADFSTKGVKTTGAAFHINVGSILLPSTMVKEARAAGFWMVGAVATTILLLSSLCPLLIILSFFRRADEFADDI